MSINWAHFTPWSALFGGLLIGFASGAFILFNGRIAGFSGLLGNLLSRSKPGRFEGALFLLGAALAPLIWWFFKGQPQLRFDTPWPQLILAGLLTGLGTRYANGCTSGHGICGLARLSPRSLVAVVSFMATGFLTVFVVRHLL